jgi:glycosyltransferase involved in cell wall biosynthesis
VSSAGGVLEIVIPARNEAARLGLTLHSLLDYVPSLPVATRLTVVDNASSDATGHIAREILRATAGDRVIVADTIGKGAAVRAAVGASDAQWIGFMDADLATPLRFLHPVLAELRAGREVVIGSRRIAGARCTAPHPLVRRTGAWVFRCIARRLVKDVADTQCGFKFFSGPIARQVFSQARVDGFCFDVEVLGLAQRAGISIVEVPVEWTARPGSSFRMLTDGPKVAADLIRARRRLNEAAREDQPVRVLPIRQ